MCVGIPGKVILIKDQKAKIKQGNHTHWVDISSLSDEVRVGDYLLTYQDAGINVISQKEAEEILKLMDSASNAGIESSD